MYIRMALAFALAGICGCRTVMKLFEPDDPIDTSVVATWWDGPRIRPGIALVVQVGSLASQPVVMNALVDQNGEITLPHLLQHSVVCDGLTLEALKDKLVKEYSVYYKQPQVTVMFAPYDARSTAVSPYGTVTVMGEVAVQGPVNMPPTMDLTVTKALQMAGGVKPFANRSRVRVTRCERDGTQRKIYVDLNEIGEDGRIDKDMVLRPGDVVWVPETWY